MYSLTYSVPHILAENDASPIRLTGSVALVGNSDALLGSGLGERIDRYDSVFRFNLADLDPRYAGDVGRKVDYVFFSLNVSTRKYPHTPEEHARFVHLCESARVICYPDNTANVRQFNDAPLLMTMSMEQLNRVLFRATRPEAIQFSYRNHPRNGIKLLACLLHAGVRPDLFGFDLGDRGDNSHYFDDQIQREVPEGGHIPSREYALLRLLRDRRLVRLF